jgi:hypothetical protein
VESKNLTTNNNDADIEVTETLDQLPEQNGNRSADSTEGERDTNCLV